MDTTTADRQALQLAADGALFFCSHSGGKDSLATYQRIRDLGIPDEQIVLVHADLGAAEWPGTISHIEANTSHDLNVVRAGKTFLGMVRNRMATRPDVAPWPSPKYRQCTSDLKRGPIYKLIRQTAKAEGCSIVVNVMGLRAEESSARAKRPAFEENAKLTTRSRQGFNWYPIHDWDTPRVKGYVLANGMTLGQAYQTGNERQSCRLCIMGCPGDLANAARQFPELVAEYTAIEQESGFTMFHGMSLAEKIASHNDAPSQGSLI